MPVFNIDVQSVRMFRGILVELKPQPWSGASENAIYGMLATVTMCRIRRAVYTTPPWGGFSSSRLLENQEGANSANTERVCLRKALGEMYLSNADLSVGAGTIPTAVEISRMENENGKSAQGSVIHTVVFGRYLYFLRKPPRLRNSIPGCKPDVWDFT